MSVWKRLQRVGKKAAKYQISFSLQEVKLNCTDSYNPGPLIIVLSHRTRRHTSDIFTCSSTSEPSNNHAHLWELPENLEFTTTLYRSEKALEYEEKQWICQLEECGNNPITAKHRSGLASIRRRVLGAVQINIASLCSTMPNQISRLLELRPTSKKVLKASLLLTIHSVVLKEGDAIDDDLISLASLASLSRSPSICSGSFADLKLQPYRKDSSIDGSSSSPFHLPPTYPASKTDSSSRRDRSTTLKGDDDFDLTNPMALTQLTNQLSQLASGQGETTDNVAPVSSSSNDREDSTNTTPTHRPNPFSSPSTTTKPPPPAHHHQQHSSPQQLLTWCREATQSYAQVTVTDLTTSFQSGLALCAILHHFHPDKIEFDTLLTLTPAECCRLGLDVATQLGVPRIIDVGDLVERRQPDLLTMLTYLHQLRTVCCCPEMTDQQPSPPTLLSTTKQEQQQDETRRIDHGQNIDSRKSTSLVEPQSDHHSPVVNGEMLSPERTEKKNLSDSTLARARALLDAARNTHSPVNDGDSASTRCKAKSNEVLVDCQARPPQRQPEAETSSQPVLSSGSKGISKRSKLLRFNPDGSVIQSTDGVALKSTTDGSAITSSLDCLAVGDQDEQSRPRRLKLGSSLKLFSSGHGAAAPVATPDSAPPCLTTNRPYNNNSTNQDSTADYRYSLSKSSLTGIVKANDSSPGSFVESELAQLDEEQRSLDSEAASLERKLREVMVRAPGSSDEGKLMTRWFVLVNRKNALIRRSMQLSALEKEDDLKKKMQMLQAELRQIIFIEDSLKCEADRKREALLLKDLLSLVNERNELIEQVDVHEQALGRELVNLQPLLSKTFSSNNARRDNCVLQ